MEQGVITIFGGSGFLGRYVVRQLAQAGYRIRIVSRNPEGAQFLKTAGDVGQIAIVSGNITRPQSLNGKLERSFAVINLVGLLYESGRQNFSAVHSAGAERLAQLAHAAGVQRFIQISALGIDKAKGSKYARTKLLGEKAVQAAFPGATILRPSVVFGPEDNFINQFARMAHLAPALPLIGDGKTRFQPVYVGDIARAIETCLTHADTAGQVYELGGPHIYTFKEILDYIQRTIGTRTRYLKLPFGIASLIGLGNELLPFRPLLTRDQVKLLKHDNVVGADAKTFLQLGIRPTAMEVVAPDYLARFHKKAAA